MFTDDWEKREGEGSLLCKECDHAMLTHVISWQKKQTISSTRALPKFASARSTYTKTGKIKQKNKSKSVKKILLGLRDLRLYFL